MERVVPPDSGGNEGVRNAVSRSTAGLCSHVDLKPSNIMLMLDAIMPGRSLSPFITGLPVGRTGASLGDSGRPY